MQGSDGRWGEGFRVPQSVGGFQGEPKVTAAGPGFAVAWVSSGADARGVVDGHNDAWLRVFGADGRPRGPAMQLTPSLPRDHWVEDMATLRDGSLVVVTSHEQPQADYALTAHRFDATGERVSGPKTLARDIDTGFGDVIGGGARTPQADLAALPDGGFALAWHGAGATGGASIRVRAFDADADARSPARIASPPGDVRDFWSEGADLTAVPGGLALTWTRDPYDDAQQDAFHRRLDASGRPAGPARLVNDGDTVGLQAAQDVVHLGAGYTLALYRAEVPGLGETWEEHFGIRGRAFGPDGRAIGGVLNLSEYAYLDGGGAEGAVLRDGRVALAWEGGPDEDIFARVLGGGDREPLRIAGHGLALSFAAPEGGRLGGTKGADLIVGGAGRDTILGRSGADVLLGGRGSDDLRGHGGRDRLFGGPGDDRLEGGPGSDVLAGGGGADRFVFARGDGRDRVRDFQPGRDTLVLDDDLWRGPLSRSEVVRRYAERDDDVAVLDFGWGDVITLEGVESLRALASDLSIG